MTGGALAARRPGWELPPVHEGLQTDPIDVLWENRERKQCPKCNRRRSLLCYDCQEPLTEPGTVPFVHLPFKVSIITHHEEHLGNNTGIQLAILAKGQVQLHRMDEFPSNLPPANRCAVLFPSDDALDVEDLEPDSIDHLFIIDSKWQKARELNRSPLFRDMRRIRLNQTRSCFWRFHTKGVTDDGVSTAEALYFLCKSLSDKNKLQSNESFQKPRAFDNLLWYFVFQHDVVANAVERRKNAGSNILHSTEGKRAKKLRAANAAIAAAEIEKDNKEEGKEGEGEEREAKKVCEREDRY
uniref:tRNA-uridine aminocarboxypropyltransferase 1 n=1 Tax=Polytomella parva TaxID=51329 RepID=A0A7S0V7Z6_9CHLO|mmetsp:Transcript_32416/g.58879  ORF Transcript_32416/g.58879 Transcript_32416/m.58879 type:complete len:298 (+) Transcript_32416:51-944(+)